MWEFSGNFSDDRAIFGEFWKFRKLFYYFYLFSEIRFSVARSGPLVIFTALSGPLISFLYINLPHSRLQILPIGRPESLAIGLSRPGRTGRFWPRQNGASVAFCASCCGSALGVKTPLGRPSTEENRLREVPANFTRRR